MNTKNEKNISVAQLLKRESKPKFTEVNDVSKNIPKNQKTKTSERVKKVIDIIKKI